MGSISCRWTLIQTEAKDTMRTAFLAISLSLAVGIFGRPQTANNHGLDNIVSVGEWREATEEDLRTLVKPLAIEEHDPTEWKEVSQEVEASNPRARKGIIKRIISKLNPFDK